MWGRELAAVLAAALAGSGDLSPSGCRAHAASRGLRRSRVHARLHHALAPLALLGNAFYAILVDRLAIYAPRILPTLGRPYAVALHFIRHDQFMAGLAPAGVRPCRAH